MKITTRLIATVCLVVMLASCFASCGANGEAASGSVGTVAKAVTVTTADTENGTVSVSPRGKVTAGTEVTVNVAPDRGYKLTAFAVGGVDCLGALNGNTYTFAANENTQIAATFAQDLCAVKGTVATPDDSYESLAVALVNPEDAEDRHEATVNPETGAFQVSVLPGEYVLDLTHDYYDEQTEAITVISDRDLGSVRMSYRTMGASATSGQATPGAFMKSCGSYVSNYSGELAVSYFKNFKAKQYILQVDLGAVASDPKANANPTPSIVIAQNTTATLTVYFDLKTGKCGLAQIVNKVVTKDTNAFDFDVDAMKSGFVTVTVVRDGKNVDVYLDGTKTISVQNSALLNANDASCGYMVDGVVAEYKNPILTDDLTKLNDLLAKATKTPAAPSETKRPVDVIIIAGQSNCTGHTNYEFLRSKFPALYNEYAEGFENVYINYISNTYESYRFTNVRFGQGYLGSKKNNRYGAEIGMAAYLTELNPDKDYYIIKVGYSATSLMEQWASPSYSADGSAKEKYVLYDAFVKESLKQLEDMGLDPQVLSFVWLQGESDAKAAMVPVYAGCEKALISDVRDALADYAKNDTVGFVDVACNNEMVDGKYMWAEWEGINNAKIEVCNSLPQYSVFFDPFGTYHLSCAKEQNDNDGAAHYDSKDCIELGRLIMQYVLSLDY